MTISVLMSVYKNENPAFFDRSMCSIWDDQTLKPNQIVLIEDGPLGKDLDRVIETWCQKLGDVLCLLKNETNIGLTKSLNKGIEKVTSELIARMDSDDISSPDRFRLQHDYLATHPEVHILGGSLQEFNEQSDCLTIRHYPQKPEVARRYICKASPLAHPTVMMRRKIFDNGLRYNEKYRTSQDIALWFDALHDGYNIANLDAVTIHFRRSKDLIKRRGKQKAKKEFSIYMNGIYHLFGPITYKYIYPISRLVFRMMPPAVIKYFYNSPWRHLILNKQK